MEYFGIKNNSYSLIHENSTDIQHLVLYFQSEMEIEKWIDPYDSMGLKLFTVIVYVVEVLASVIMLAFVAYETGGYAGHYRTVINQLLSCLYGAVSRLFWWDFLATFG